MTFPSVLARLAFGKKVTARKPARKRNASPDRIRDLFVLVARYLAICEERFSAFPKDNGTKVLGEKTRNHFALENGFLYVPETGMSLRCHENKIESHLSHD